MGWLSKPDAPDPAKTAAAQQTLNLSTSTANAEQGHVNQVTPFGNQSWSQSGTNPDGTPQYTQTNTLAPQMQTMLDAQMKQDNALTNTGNSLIDQVNNNIKDPIDTSGMSPVYGGVSGQQLSNFNDSYSKSAGPAAQAQAGMASATHAGYGKIQDQLQGGTDFGAQATAAQNAALQNQMVYLQPQQRDTGNQLTDSLRQQGITQESNPAAYQHAMDQQNRNNTFQNQSAYNTSFASGLNAQNQLFNQNLGASNFANAAQNQGFGQSAWNAGADNTASLQNANNQTQVSLANMAAQNQNNQFNVNANNSATSTQFGNALQNNQASNAANAQQMQNMFALRNAPMNELSSIRSATPVANPTFNQYQQGNAQAPNYMGAVQNNYQSEMGSYNNMMSGLFNLGSSIIGAPKKPGG
jgi:hypothetical protein